MKKVLLINGSPNVNGCTYTALKEIQNTLKEEGIESDIHWIGNKPIPGCTACKVCYTSECIFKDQVNELLNKIDDYGGIVVGSPVYYAGPSGQLCAFLDRLFYSSKGRMKYKLGASIVSCRRGGASSAFDRLNKYFTISEMPLVSSCYWNQVHGNTPSEVIQDEEGMRTMRVLARNMAWLMKCIDKGNENNIPYPIKEAPKRTNFIR